MRSTPTQEAALADVVGQLKIANRLLAAQLTDRMQQNDLVSLLSSTGASTQDIADVLGTPPGTVANARFRSRKKGSKPQRRRGRKTANA